MVRSLIALSLMLSPAALWAQSGQGSLPGQIEAPSGADWVHRGSGMGFPSRLIGIERQSVQDNSRGSLDVVGQYRAGESTILTIYVFRAARPDPALWFEQARFALEANPAIRGSEGGAMQGTTRSFEIAGSPVGNGMVLSYPISANGFRATALAMIPMGDWTIKLRMTSRDMDQAEIATRIVEAAQALQWPRQPAFSAPPGPVRDCSERLPAIGTAQERQANPELIAQASAGLAASAAQLRSAALCRDRQEQIVGIYRASQEQDGYTLALGDSGRLVRVRRLEGGGAGAPFVVELIDLDAAYVAGFFSALPSFEQAFVVGARAIQTGGLARISLGTATEQARPDPSLPVT